MLWISLARTMVSKIENYLIQNFWTDVSNSSRTNACSFWADHSSIKPMITVQSIRRTMHADNFNTHFKNVFDLISSSFTTDSSLLWKGQESKYTFIEFQRIDLIKLLIPLFDKTVMDVLVFNWRLVRLALLHIVDSLLFTLNDYCSRWPETCRGYPCI